MRKPVIDNVEIIEPPIGELSKQRSSLKKTCLTGCGCVVFLIIGGLLGLRFFVGSGPSTIKSLPKNFPLSIPVYEKDSIDTMTFISGTYKKRSIEIAAFFPKVILSPLLLRLGPHNDNTTSSGFIEANKDFWAILTAPVGDARDTVEIEWKNMDAEPKFVMSYYKKELGKQGYTISDVSSDQGTYQLTFNRNDGVGGSLYAKGDEEDHPGTDYASLTVNIPQSYQNP